MSRLYFVYAAPIRGSYMKRSLLFLMLVTMLALLGCTAIEETALQLPPPKRIVPYPNEPNWDDFDLQISSSLNGYPRAELTFDSSVDVKSEELPARLNRWLLKISSSGGRVYICPSEQVESTDPILAILRVAGQVALDLWRENLKYRPAESVHAKIYVRQADLEDQNAALSRIEFVRRKLELDTDNCKESSVNE